MAPFHLPGIAQWASSSLLGQCQFCEPTGLANPADIFHVNPVGPLLMTFDVSASKQALAFGDSEGCVHLWTDSPEASFNPYSRETEFALPCLVDSLPPLDWSQDLLPLSLIPVPLTTDTLLSDWPAANSAPAPRLYLISGPKRERGKGLRYQDCLQALWLFSFFPDVCLPSVFSFFSGSLGTGDRYHYLQALELYCITGEHPLWMQRFCAP